MDTKSILFLGILLLTSGFAVGQTSLIQGKINCSNDKGDCCLECPLISLISNDSIFTTPDKTGNFEMTIDKSSGTFPLRFQSIGFLTLEINDVPYNDMIVLNNVYLYSCSKITPAKYKRISRQFKKKFKNLMDYQNFMTDNFSEIIPVGGKRFYYDCSLITPRSMMRTINDEKKVIRLSYRDLKK